MQTIGVIGGSGLYEMAGLDDVERVRVHTPFGDPSDELVRATRDGVRLVFLPRHGRGHRVLPSELNFRANIFAMKALGVERIVGIGAVGSLREEIVPGHLVVPDQLIDRTKGRVSTFFGGGIVAHVGFADPFCGSLGAALVGAAHDVGARVHPRGTYLCMEGPQFSTRAESNLYRHWGADIIGMTALQEAKLAREAEICYATLALATDYDCWHESEADVVIGDVLRILADNVATAQRVIAAVATRLPDREACACGRALEHAIITDRSLVPPELKERLGLLIGKYL